MVSTAKASNGCSTSRRSSPNGDELEPLRNELWRSCEYAALIDRIEGSTLAGNEVG
jgi:hypothetical protein